MPFPDAQRVIYRRNPLAEVVCQLRFPPILSIDAGVPALFQERIRGEFPEFSEMAELHVEVPTPFKTTLPPELVQQFVQSAAAKNYTFSSDDGAWRANLTRTFVALTTTKYERWEQFKDRLQIPLSAVVDVYAPAYFTRIGLRYVDVIRRSALEMSDTDWSDLLQPYIVGILGAPGVGNSVANFESRYEVTLGDGRGTVRIVTKFVEAEEGGEVCFGIDSDFFTTDRTLIDSAMEALDFFNVRASRLMRWCISDRLHASMDPREVP